MIPWNSFEKKLLIGVGLLLTLIVWTLNELRIESIRDSLTVLNLDQSSPASEHRRRLASASTDSAFDPLSASTSDLPQDPFGEAVRWGEKIVTQTKTELPAHVGNDLSCTNCHLNGGRKAGAAPWIGIWGVFPEYRARSGKINTLEERVNDCFERSLNGKPLPSGRPEMAAILSYMKWLSTGIPTGQNFEGRGFIKLKALEAPDVDHGRTLYAQRCSSCHGSSGSGQYQADGKVLFPPLWGDKSFNIGAGMARLNTAAAFIQHNMPQGQENSLSTVEAFAIAAFVTRQPRPDFQKKRLDWPKGQKPEDARY